MQAPSLDKLLLTDDELQAARNRIQEMAYFKWQDAGCPADSGDGFWIEAEREWIEYYYVPNRNASTIDVRSRPAQTCSSGLRQTGRRLRGAVPRAE